MLVDLWESSREQLADKHVQQVIAFAGDGKLREDNETSRDFRAYLSAVPSEMLTTYAQECLVGFDNSGFALQDIVNEVGRRLGFQVAPGRYRGTRNEPGQDGLWRSDDGSLVVEIKTSSAYSIDLDVVAGYRKALIDAKEVGDDSTSILLVVGRFDTGGWEAQTRGSRHSWLLRLISVDALLRLLRIKEQLDDPAALYKIREILKPYEYTLVDGIIDLVFSTAEDLAELETDNGSDEEDEDVSEAGKPRKEHAKPVAFHAESIRRAESSLGLSLIKDSRSTWVSADGKTAVQCSVSKRHGEGAFWFAFHAHQKERLEGYEQAYLVLGCGSAERTLLVPLSRAVSWLDKIWTTKVKDREYWHVKVRDAPTGLELLTRAGVDAVPLGEYIIAATEE